MYIQQLIIFPYFFIKYNSNANVILNLKFINNKLNNKVKVKININKYNIEYVAFLI